MLRGLGHLSGGGGAQGQGPEHSGDDLDLLHRGQLGVGGEGADVALDAAAGDAGRVGEVDWWVVWPPPERAPDGADTVNVPDLVKFDLRSWQATALARESARRPDGTAYRAIPHLRAAGGGCVEPTDALHGGRDGRGDLR